MNKRKLVLIISIIILIIIGLGIYIKQNNYDIPNDYIAIFHGGVGERTYETYIYKIDNGQANFGFKYINVTNTTESWGSSNWKQKINKKGKFDWTDGAFAIAKKHGAYSYVTLPNDNNIYTIEEFQSMFIMN
ncbi:MAG: hypothetical protein E7170_04045 [Firmicutes bacterium]|nr:hypothetical protein [Bacillota bacterium]